MPDMAIHPTDKAAPWKLKIGHQYHGIFMLNAK